MFDPERSPVQRDCLQLKSVLVALERILPEAKAVGAVEIGSYAKGEAVEDSDSDLRVYIRCPDILYVLAMHEEEDQPVGLAEYLGTQPQMETVRVYIGSLIKDINARIDGAVENEVHIGFVDVDFADFLFSHMDRYPTQDHAMLFQSTVLHDPEGWIQSQRRRLADIRPPAGLVEMYLTQARRRALELLPHYAESPPAARGADQWLLEAVRSVREAVALRGLIEDGAFVYRRDDVLAWIRRRDEVYAELITKLYQ